MSMTISDNLFDVSNSIVSWADEACQEPRKRRRRGRVSISEVSDIHRFVSNIPIRESITQEVQTTSNEVRTRNLWKDSPGRLKEVINGKKVPMGSVIQVFQNETSSKTVENSRIENFKEELVEKPAFKYEKPVKFPDFWKKKNNTRNFQLKNAKSLVLNHLHTSQPEPKSSFKDSKKKEKGINTNRHYYHGIHKETQCESSVEELSQPSEIVDDYVWVEKVELQDRLRSYIVLYGLGMISFAVGLFASRMV